MPLVQLRPKNQVTLPAEVIRKAGIQPGDYLEVTANEAQVIITPKEIRDRNRSYKMTDLLGAAKGSYQSAEEIDQEIDHSRAE